MNTSPKVSANVFVTEETAIVAGSLPGDESIRQSATLRVGEPLNGVTIFLSNAIDAMRLAHAAEHAARLLVVVVPNEAAL
jgi:hypothetical protein